MNTFERYIPASSFRRAGAFSANAMCLGFLGLIWQEGLNLPMKGNPHFYSLCCLLVIASVLFPESPGKRICNIVILGTNKEKIERRIRFLRALPFIILALLYALSPVTQNFALFQIMGSLVDLIFLAIILNGMSIFVIPSRCSIFDLLLKTQVMTPPPLEESLKPKFRGLRIR